jgi:hypothetical protein
VCVCAQTGIRVDVERVGDGGLLRVDDYIFILFYFIL